MAKNLFILLFLIFAGITVNAQNFFGTHKPDNTPEPVVECYGYLYNWYSVDDSRNIANTGWSVPTYAQLTTLTTYLGGGSIAGGKLKAEGEIYWQNPNTGATNETGFHAVGAGFRNDAGGFRTLQRWTEIMSLTLNDPPDNAIILLLTYDAAIAWGQQSDSHTGHSIRLLKDTPTAAELLLSDGEAADPYTGLDGKVYNTVKIGTQVWLSENLEETQFANGDPIYWVKDNTEWANLTEGALCIYENDTTYACKRPLPIEPVSAFITEWDVPTGSFTLPLPSGYTYDMTVDWGDGSGESTVTAYNDADATHTYSSAATVQIKISGTCQAWYMFNTSIQPYLKKIISWGDVGFTGSGFQKAFFGCSNLTSLPTGSITGASGVTYLGDFLRGCTGLISIPSGFFDQLTNLIQFNTCFEGCNGITAIPADLFKYNTSVSNSAFSGTFRDCTSLTSVPTDLFRYNTSVSSFGFNSTFEGCTGLAAMPTDLFRYNTLVSGNGFNSTFEGCSGITSIPTDLFRYNTLVSSSGFYETFRNCSGITTIPIDLFRYNTAVSSSGFYATFQGCSSITVIPADLFKHNTSVDGIGFFQTFHSCTSLTSIPTDLFRYNTAVTNFARVFLGCTGLTSIPTDLFRYNTAVTDFNYAFFNCISLATVPDALFKYNTVCTNFSGVFRDCTALQLNQYTFYESGERDIRFFDQSINFTQVLDRATFTGAQGTAPDLWNCDFGTGIPTKTNCWEGAGNSTTSLSNYNDIPSDWK